MKWGARLSRNINRPRNKRALTAGTLSPKAAAASSVESWLCHARARRPDIFPASAEPLPLQAESFEKRLKPARGHPPSSVFASGDIGHRLRLDPKIQRVCVAEAAQFQY